jgi:hypothetical protein
MGMFDTVTVDVLSADFQTKQLGERMLRYQLATDGRLVAPCGVVVAFTAWFTCTGRMGAEFMAIFTHGRLESLDPIIPRVSDTYRCLGEGLLWTRGSW